MRKALKTVLCVALILALTAIVALRVLPPMDTPAQSAAATPTPVVPATPTPTPAPAQSGANASIAAGIIANMRSGAGG